MPPQGGKKSSSKMTTVSMAFVSPNYHLKLNLFPITKADSEIVTRELLDQSTIEKMLTVDALSVIRTGIATPHIENVKLEHRHCLIDYTFEGLPEGAEVSLLTSSIKLKPLVTARSYAAILQNPQLASVQVKVGDEVHEVSLGTSIKTLPIELRVVKDVHYKFVVKYDDSVEAIDTDKMLTIENMTAQKWSEEEFAAEKQLF